MALRLLIQDRHGMLELDGISKTFHRVRVLDGIGARIPEGAIAGFIGPNGAGKSTLLDILTGFERPDRGTVRFRGAALVTPWERMTRFAYIPERITLYPDAYVGEFIDFLARITTCSRPELAQELGLSGVRGTRIRALSKGFRQRLKLYAALANTKPVVVLDEPLDGFDPIRLPGIIGLLQRENSTGRTLVLSIHQLHIAERICNYLVLLHEGRAVMQGSMEALRRKTGLEQATLEEIFVRALQ